jgi:hypothetical protein
MYLNRSSNIDIESNDGGSGSELDDTDEYLHSGLLKSEPDSDSSGITIPFHKLNRTSYRKNKGNSFLSHFSNTKVNPGETVPDTAAPSEFIESLLESNDSVQSNRDSGIIPNKKLKKQSNATRYSSQSRKTSAKNNSTKKSKNGNRTQGQKQRRKRQVEFPLHGNERGADWSPKCGARNPDEEITETPLMCYQCRSMSKHEDPGSCDPDLWKYLRKSEKHSQRIRCPENRGHYCVQSVGDKGGGDRRTVRGCMGAGPLATKDGKNITLREGCISYMDGDYWTKTCFCKNDLCNLAADDGREGDGSLISTIIVCWAIFMYAFCCISVSHSH